MTEVFICDGIRTPIGRYGGALSGVRTDDLAALPIKAARMDEWLAPTSPTPPPSLRQEFEFSDCAGQLRWGDVQITAVRNEQGDLDSLLITVLDVSDRRQIEIELLRQFSFLRALLDTIPNPIFYRGTDNRLLGCNLAYENFFGVDRRDLIGKRVLELDYLSDDIRQACQAEDERIIAEGSGARREMQLTDGSGQLRAPFTQ